jgi:hypothetical protein
MASLHVDPTEKFSDSAPGTPLQIFQMVRHQAQGDETAQRRGQGCAITAAYALRATFAVKKQAKTIAWQEI